MHAGIHQLPAVAALDLDDEILAILEQAQGTAVFRNRGGVEQNKTFHGFLKGRGQLCRVGSSLKADTVRLAMEP
ncbi:hypothetical protein D3C86_1818490 [compost metagenome]